LSLSTLSSTEKEYSVTFAKISTMKIKYLFYSLIIVGMLGATSCGSKYDLKEDAGKIGTSMCKSIDIMNQLKAANPQDSDLVWKLRQDAKNTQIEMTILYQEFNKKWGDKTKKEDFTKAFGRELRKAMLDCKSLSKEDRENFMKELKE
jgi:hypothetical protein